MAMRARNRIATKRGTCAVCQGDINPGDLEATYSAEEVGEDVRAYHEHAACADLAACEQYEEVFDSQADMPADLQRAYRQYCRNLGREPTLT